MKVSLEVAYLPAEPAIWVRFLRLLTFEDFFFLLSHFLLHLFFLKWRFLKRISSWKFFSDLIRECIFLQLEKPSGSEIELSIHKRLAIDFLEGMVKRTPPQGPDRVKRYWKWSKKLSWGGGQRLQHLVNMYGSKCGTRAWKLHLCNC